MTLLQFVDKHPFFTFLIVFIVLASLEEIVKSMRGRH